MHGIIIAFTCLCSLAWADRSQTVEAAQKADPWVGTYKAFEKFSDGLYRPTDRADAVAITEKDGIYEGAFPGRAKEQIRFKIDGKRVDGTPRFLRVPDESALPIVTSFLDRGTTVLALQYSFNSIYFIKGEPSKKLPVATPAMLKLYARFKKDGQPKEEGDVKFAKTLGADVTAAAIAFLAGMDDPTINVKLKNVSMNQKDAAAAYKLYAARGEDRYVILRFRSAKNDIVLIYSCEKQIIMCAICSGS
jgi:hypothetical protein